MRELELLSVVALLKNVADHDLLRGQVGTVVEQLAPGVYEVEFSDDDGRTYATLSLRSDQLLQNRPVLVATRWSTGVSRNHLTCCDLSVAMRRGVEDFSECV